MAIILAVLLLALILGGLGFAVHVLWWIALIAASASGSEAPACSESFPGSA